MTGSLPGRGSSSISGILNVDKPLGLSSHALVVAIRKLSGQRKAGHAGTLDPLATGVLLVCLGKATRVSQFLMDSHKTYYAAVRLGVSTTTHDAEGEVVAQAGVDVEWDEVTVALKQFVGRIDQVPPIYSAIKVGGKRLYELARRGVQVSVPSRQVDVYRLDAIEWAPPMLTLEVECGPGTYIRALARDLGEALGCGAHLAGLRRTKSGQFTADRSVTLSELEAAAAARSLMDHVHSLDAAFAHLPALHLDAEDAYHLALGQAVPDLQRDEEETDAPNGPGARALSARAYAPGGLFVALAIRDADNAVWKPQKVFVEPADILSMDSTPSPPRARG